LKSEETKNQDTYGLLELEGNDWCGFEKENKCAFS